MPAKLPKARSKKRKQRSARTKISTSRQTRILLADLMSVLENVTEGIARFDTGGNFLDLNRNFLSLLGYDRDLLFRMKWTQLLARADHRTAIQAYRKMLKSGKAAFEARVMRRNNDPLYAEIVLVRCQSTRGIFGGHHCFVRDISARKRAEQQLRESELQYRFLFEHNPHPMWVYDPHTLRYLAVNQAAIQHYGYTREEFLSMTLADIRPTNEIPAMLEGIRRTFRLSETARLVRPGIMRHRTKEGRLVHVEITFSRIQFDGKVAHLAMANDVTERLTAESLVEEQRSKMIASSRMSALGEMAGGIAHEINTPLTVLYGRTSQLKGLAESGKWDQAIYLRNLTLIEDTAMKISSIVRGLRAFARDGAQDPLFETSVKSLLEDTLSFCQEKIKSHGVSVQIDPYPETLTLACRPPQISQVLLNLLNNALDATRAMPERWIRITIAEKGDSLEFAITDSGSGIPLEHHHRLFQPFFTTKEVGKGTGLGLSISHGIVKSHRGSLTLDLASPHTRFIIRIPRSPGKGNVEAA